MKKSRFSKRAINTPRPRHTEQYGYEGLRGAGIVSGSLLGGCLGSLYDLLKGIRYPEEKEIAKQYHIFPDIPEWQDKILLLKQARKHLRLLISSKCLKHLAS